MYLDRTFAQQIGSVKA